ncbi:MAG: hypothetical protein ABIZ91_11005 [Gemmatimonadaceae bacterium]
MAGKWLQPDPSQGDADTIGGYMRVHARPAAFEGSDGVSYSVSIETDRTGESDRPFAAWFLFLRWRRVGQQGVEGHLETPYLTWGATAGEAQEALGAFSLSECRAALEHCLQDAAAEAPPARKWWDVMRDES